MENIKKEAVTFGEFVVKWKKLLKKEEYEACLREVRSNKNAPLIEKVIVEKGLINEEQMAVLLTEFKIGKYLTGKGLLSRERYEDCLHAQRVMSEMGISKAIDCVITEKGFLSEDQMKQILNEIQGGDERMIKGYRITRKIGEGAMGIVYEALDLAKNVRVAIKILYPHLAKSLNFAKRFMREAKLCLKLNHPNIVKGYEVGLAGDRYFYVMELVEGDNLRQILEKRRKLYKEGCLKEIEAVRIMKAVASALEYATKYKLIHRDIKPDNIIISKDGKTKLCDLGLARTLKDDMSLTKTGMVVGTPFYISPEAAKGDKQLDIRSDIYSLGATMYHMVTGRVPFEGDDSAVVLEKHRNEGLVPPIKWKEDLTQGFSAIIEKMMAKEREDRYQTPADLINILNQLISSASKNASSTTNPIVQKTAQTQSPQVTKKVVIKVKKPPAPPKTEA